MKHTHEYNYAGIPTFMGSEYITAKQLEKYDVGVIGIPTDHGASYRLGAKYAPRHIRECSFWDRVEGTLYHDLDKNKTLSSNSLKIGDLGDININPSNSNANNKHIIQTLSEIRAKAFPLILGGDHSITYPALIGCKKEFRDKRIGLIYFDSHLDVEKKYLNLPKVWHGNVFRKLVAEGYLAGEDIICIGANGLVENEHFDYFNKNNMTLYSARDIGENGIATIINSAKDKLNKCDAVYVSFDIDVLNATDGTGTPHPGGVSVSQAIEAVRLLREFNIIGFDLVEVNPKYDFSGRTGIDAADILYNFLAFGLKNK